MTGTWPYRAVATAIYIYNTRHCLIRLLIRSFDDISLLFLYFRGQVYATRKQLVLRASSNRAEVNDDHDDFAIRTVRS